MKRTGGVIFGIEYSPKLLSGSLPEVTAWRYLVNQLTKIEDVVGMAMFEAFNIVLQVRSFPHFMSLNYTEIISRRGNLSIMYPNFRITS
jgi:hypothetical protein